MTAPPFSPTDANTYIDPPPAAVEPMGYPRMMYHPTNPSVVVNDSAGESALIASDSQWTRTDPNATT